MRGSHFSSSLYWSNFSICASEGSTWGSYFWFFIHAYRQVLSDLLCRPDTVSRVNIMKIAKVALVQPLVPCKEMDDKESEERKAK